MYFGLTIESLNFNYSYLGGPVETELTIPISIVRSWDVWSPGNGQVEYLDWSDLNPSPGVYNWTALNAWIAANQANNNQMVYTFRSASLDHGCNEPCGLSGIRHSHCYASQRRNQILGGLQRIQCHQHFTGFNGADAGDHLQYRSHARSGRARSVLSMRRFCSVPLQLPR
jgi:hypothetical protein